MTLPATGWALKHMPLTAAAVGDHEALLAGRRLAMCLHVEPKTAALVTLLARAGVDVTLTGSPGTTHDDVADDLRALGVKVHTRRADDDADHARNVAKVLETEPDLTLDNGADLTLSLLESGTSSGYLGGTEETTTGGLRPGAARRRHAPGRRDQRLAAETPGGERVRRRPERRAGLSQRHQPDGAGDARHGARLRAVRQGRRRHPRAARRARRRVRHRPHARTSGHFGRSPRRRRRRSARRRPSRLHRDRRPGVVGAAELAALPDGAVLAGVGHFAWEIDAEALRTATVRTIEYGDPGRRTGHVLTGGREIVVLDHGRMLNLTAANGNSIQAMDLGLTLQVRSLAAVCAGGLAPVVQPVPAAVERRIATDLVERLR